MSIASMAQPVIPSGGTLSNMIDRSVSVDATGSELDLSAIGFEDSRKKSNHIALVNTGDNEVYLGFDVDASDVDTTDETTYNLVLGANLGADIDRITLCGEASKVAYKCATGETTTLKIRAW